MKSFSYSLKRYLGGDIWTRGNEDEQKYIYEREGTSRTVAEQIDYIADLVETYKFFYVEDQIGRASCRERV